MQSLANVASQFAEILGTLVPTFSYLAALGCFLFAGWGFWRQAQPDNPFHGRPWVPLASLLFSGLFASFDTFLTMANASGGSDIAVSVGALTSYGNAGAASGLMGASPGESITNIVTLFQGFFQTFGAMCAFFAVLTWRSVINGSNNRSHGGCFVQFVFGVMLINILPITQSLIALFTA